MKTRTSSLKAEEIQRISRFNRKECVEALGFSGGIWLFWDEASRNQLWNYLTQVGLAIQFPWLLVGDFNEIVASTEKKGGRPFWRERNHNMQRFIDQCNLIDLGFSGPGLTWTNFRDGRANVRKRLDRAISNRKWRLLFPEAQVVHLARTHSDHHPVLLEVERQITSGGQRPFRT